MAAMRGRFARTLVPYYLVVSRIAEPTPGDPVVDCTGQGVWFVEAAASYALDMPLVDGVISGAAATAGCADLVRQFCCFASRQAKFLPSRDRPSGLVGHILLNPSAHKEATAGLFCYALLLCGLLSCCCFSWDEALVQTRILLFMWDPGGMRTLLVQPFKLFTWKEANTQWLWRRR